MFAKLKIAWRAFNNWRRSAFPFRLTVLLILLVFTTGLLERVITENHSPLINELVWIACKAIRNASQPPISSAYLRYYRARENQRLQSNLRDRMHSGGVLLSPDEMAAVNTMPSKVDNKIMFDIAKRHGVISAGVSQLEYMRSLWAASLSMNSMEFDKKWDEVKHDVFSSGKLFDRNRNWSYGVYLFVYNLMMIAPIPLTATVPWFVICLTLAFIAVRNPTSKPQRMLAIALPILLTLIWTSQYLINLFQPAHSWLNYFRPMHLSYILYFSILSVIPGILAIRLRKWTNKHGFIDKVLPCLMFIAGVLLIFHPMLCSYGPPEYTFWGFPPGNILLNISSSVMLLFYLTGAVMIIYSIKLYFFRKQKE